MKVVLVWSNRLPTVLNNFMFNILMFVLSKYLDPDTLGHLCLASQTKSLFPNLWWLSPLSYLVAATSFRPQHIHRAKGLCDRFHQALFSYRKIWYRWSLADFSDIMEISTFTTGHDLGPRTEEGFHNISCPTLHKKKRAGRATRRHLRQKPQILRRRQCTSGPLNYSP